MALYGIYGSHTTEACPVNNLETAKKLVAFAESDLQSIASKYGITEVISQYHSALEHALLWVVTVTASIVGDSGQPFFLF
jgi:hypothetical protein